MGHADTPTLRVLDSVIAAELQHKPPTFQTRISRKAAA
jgi:hypothetical protein